VPHDFSTAVSVADWAQVDAFYSNLARSAALARPHESATDGDLSVAEAQIEYAKEAWTVAVRHIGGTEKDREEVIQRMSREASGE
jgi:hypothetical protein